MRLLELGVVTLLAEGEVAAARVERRRLQLRIAVPPRIVFDLVQAGNRDVYAAALDGGDLARLTDAADEDENPTAAGGMVAFTSFRDGNTELYSVPLAGVVPSRLTNTADGEMQPALSPDGGRVPSTAKPTGVFKLCTAQADGSNPRAVMSGFGSGGSIEASPSWAPSGGRLVLVSSTNGTSDLFELPLPGSPTELLIGDRAEVEPASSPDGASIAFASDRTDDTELFILTVATDELTQLANRPGSDSQPAWLPDGRIVCTARVNNTPTLRWLDPAEPDSVFEVPAGPGEAQHAWGVF